MKNRRKHLVNNCCATCGHTEFSYLYETTSTESGNTTYSDGRWVKSDIGEDAEPSAKLLYCKKCNQLHHYPEDFTSRRLDL